jgi:iron complex outermembrane receptor protein
MLRYCASSLALAPILMLSVGTASPALAQANTESAVESAEDAFGTSTGHEQIGVYDEGNVRGFSPGTAGNFRMEGMYFDIQGGLSSRVLDGETIRVGPAAQGYAFPAPTGVVDLQLKKAGDKLSVAPFLSADSFGGHGFELDAQIPLAGKTLAVATGLGVFQNRYNNGGGSTGYNLGVVPRWRPAPNVEVLAFANHQQFSDNTSGGLYITAGNFLPARMERGRYPGPDWARSDSHSDSYGVIGHANLGDWTLRTGLFRSSYKDHGGFSNLIFVDAGGGTDRQVYASPASASASTSGEIRLSRRFADGPRQHLVTATLRGRSVTGHYGGGDLVDLGTADLNEQIHVAKPVFAFTALTDDRTRQTTGGLSYSLKWKGLGEFTAGLQRTHYVKVVVAPGLPIARGTSDETLPYFSAAATLTPRLTIYGSYVRGLEDAGTAPGYASNANQVLPAISTRQYDFGLRWSPIK